MALRGNLRDFSLPDVFQLVTLSGKSGVLRIKRADAEGSVWFRDGEVFFAQSDWRTDPLGTRLVSAGRITPAALGRALDIQRSDAAAGRRMGQILVDEGYITDKVLEAFVQEQIQDTIFDLFRWEEGDFDFEPLGDAPEEDIGLSVSIENVIMEGSRRLEEWNRIKKKIPSTDVVFKMATAPGEGTFEISLKPMEWNLLLLVDSSRSVAELAKATNRTDFEVARIVYERLKASLADTPPSAFQPDLGVPVGRLLRRPPVWVAEGATVGEAARVMGEQRISSVLVRADPPGILTDRDLRTRVLGAGLGPTVPVAQVMSRPLRTAPAEMPLYDAWSLLLGAGLHHLPIARDGEIVGVLTSTDVLRSTSQGPVAVLRGIERLASRRSLPGYAARVTEMASSLLAGGLDATVIAGLVARLNDALLGPTLRWAEQALGPPPASYAWIAFGSEGRMEQTLLTDQDNALVFADEGTASRGWYQALADRVVADLRAAGFPECPGGYMATRWCGPLREWRERFRTWLWEPKPQGLLDAAIFFDHRRAAGGLDVTPLQETMAGAADLPVFLRAMAEQALRFHPPPALLLRLRGESSTVDLKKHGLSPVAFLARCYALEIASPARNTLERLLAAERAGRMDPELRETVAEAFRFLLGLRLRVQLRQLAEGRAPSNEVALSELSAVERSRLKEAFRAIRGWQELVAHRWRV